jgi:hypothetical protein
MVTLKLSNRTSNQVGQATVEYILLTAVVVGFFVKIMGVLSASGWANTLVQGPFNKDFLPSYQYGHPQAKGYGDGGGPLYHPRAINQPGTGNFRIFYVQP